MNRNSFWLNKNVCHINIFHWIEIYFDWIQICIDITKKFPSQHFSNHTCHRFKIEDVVKTFNSLNPSKCFTESSICFLELIDYIWLTFFCCYFIDLINVEVVILHVEFKILTLRCVLTPINLSKKQHHSRYCKS